MLLFGSESSEDTSGTVGQSTHDRMRTGWLQSHMGWKSKNTMEEERGLMCTYGGGDQEEALSWLEPTGSLGDVQTRSEWLGERTCLRVTLSVGQGQGWMRGEGCSRTLGGWLGEDVPSAVS